MVYEGMETVVCDAEENDWLSVSYHERKYGQKPNRAKREHAKRTMPQIKINKKVTAIAVVAVLCVALLAVMLFVDGGFSKDVFTAVKTAYSSVIFDNNQPAPVTATIALPCNVNLVDVSQDGVATFEGGRAVVSFTDGKVLQATDDSVTVALDDNTCIVYQGITDVYVAEGAQVSANSLLGKYDGSFTATISVGGETVKEVVGSETQLVWNL
ncbi:MAG: hypothetical protein K2M64_02990 [Clostridia bacterium]|nr:hypothetical protein [Clostridia bacterium]